jgi:pimeloyl-ACP methyl ester carboxylesterase
MPTVQLSTVAIDYEDTGGDLPVVVLLHGLLMDGSLWSEVAPRLEGQYRCVVPTLPLGGHRQPLSAEADCSMRGLARMVIEFLAALNLSDVVLVGNDTGGALAQLVLAEDRSRVGKAVLIACDTYDNLPPGVSGKALTMTGKLPPAAFGLFMQQLRLKPMRRLPISFGWLTKRGDGITRQWLAPIWSQSAIRADTVRVLRNIFRDRDVLNQAAVGFGAVPIPVLVVWASDDKIMPTNDGRRLAGAFPRGSYVEVADSYTLIPLDQPEALVEALREFEHANSH